MQNGKDCVLYLLLGMWNIMLICRTSGKLFRIEDVLLRASIFDAWRFAVGCQGRSRDARQKISHGRGSIHSIER